MLAKRSPNEKLIVVVAGLLLLAASGFVWSKSRSSGPEVATGALATAASAISPMDLMFKHSGNVPTETWDSF